MFFLGLHKAIQYFLDLHEDIKIISIVIKNISRSFRLIAKT